METIGRALAARWGDLIEMSLKSHLKTFVPEGLWHFAGFCKRLPTYWRLDRSENLRVQQGVPGLPLFVAPDLHVQIPESVTAYIYWRAHAFEDADLWAETTDFLKLAEGCSRLIDIGAQTGFFSALFARARTAPVSILSMEPDAQVQAILARARVLNGGDGIDWEIRHEAVSDHEGTIGIPISNRPYEADLSAGEPGDLITVPSRSLTALIESLDWTPDLLKIDVESFEYEILTTSLPVIERLRPALHLEVHWEILQRRGLDPMDFLAPLARMGYRGNRSGYRTLEDWAAAGRKEVVSRLSLKVG